jgi:hypothetical protein
LKRTRFDLEESIKEGGNLKRRKLEDTCRD